MEILLETERLILRQFTESDGEQLFALDNDPDVMRFINGGTPTPLHVIQNDILPAFLHYDERFPTYGFWAVVDKATAAWLGWVSLRPTDHDSAVLVLGYRFRKAAWGQGYATEAARALIDRAFAESDAQRVIATTYQDNLASQRVMQKLGMRFVRAFRLAPEDLTKSDTHHTIEVDMWDGDDVEYALDRAHWKAMVR